MADEGTAGNETAIGGGGDRNMANASRETNMSEQGTTKDQVSQAWVDNVMSQEVDDSPSVIGPRPPAPIPKEEWQRRFAARVMKYADWAEQPAMQCAEAGYEIMVTDCPEFADDPEGAADEEMACWTDDGDE